MHFHSDCGPELELTSRPWIKDKLTDAGEGHAMLRGTAMLCRVPWLPDPVLLSPSHAIFPLLGSCHHITHLTSQLTPRLVLSHKPQPPISVRHRQAVKREKAGEVMW